MERKHVKSTKAKSIGYDEATGVLEVEYIKGAIYHYFDVPFELYKRLMNASSKGKFLDQKIEKKYKYKRIKR